MGPSKQQDCFLQKDGSRCKANPHTSHPHSRRVQSNPDQKNAMYSLSSMSNLTSSPSGAQVRLPEVAQQPQKVLNKGDIREKIAWTKCQLQQVKKQQEETEVEIDNIEKKVEKFQSQITLIHQTKRQLQTNQKIIALKRVLSESFEEQRILQNQIQSIKELIENLNGKQSALERSINYNRENIPALLDRHNVLFNQRKYLLEDLNRLQDNIRRPVHYQEGK